MTIPFTATAECPGGEWFVDGEAQGSYPVTKHSVRTGQHTIDIESGFGHCAGYGTLTVEIRAGKEHVLPPEGFLR